MRQSKWGVFILLVLLALVLSACGQPGQPDTGQTTVDTCLECHVNEGKLLADLAANPLAEKPKAESEGEG
jgi:hypothetical protein